MDDDEAKTEQRYPLSTAKMSKTPSWIMLGFLLGAGFVIALPPLRKKTVVEPPAFKMADTPLATAPTKPPELTTIEDVFAVWGKHAQWTDGVTEVALANEQDGAFTRFYEVRRTGSIDYFRTIPRLTRRVITRGKPMPECPLQFTETEEEYQEWRQHGRVERGPERNLRPVLDVQRTQRALPEIESSKIAPPVLERITPAFEIPATEPAPKK
jgi:hypothetical protein